MHTKENTPADTHKLHLHIHKAHMHTHTRHICTHRGGRVGRQWVPKKQVGVYSRRGWHTGRQPRCVLCVCVWVYVCMCVFRVFMLFLTDFLMLVTYFNPCHTLLMLLVLSVLKMKAHKWGHTHVRVCVKWVTHATCVTCLLSSKWKRIDEATRTCVLLCV